LAVAGNLYSSPQTLRTAQEAGRQEVENTVGAPSSLGTSTIASSPPQPSSQSQNSTETAFPSLEASSASRFLTAGTLNVRMDQPLMGSSNHSNYATAQRTALAGNHRLVKYASPDSEDEETGASQSICHAAIAQPIPRPRSLIWDVDETECGDPIQCLSPPSLSFGFPNATYPQGIPSGPRTLVRRPSPLRQELHAFDEETDSVYELNNAQSRQSTNRPGLLNFSGGTFDSGIRSGISSGSTLRFLSPIPEIPEDTDSDNDGFVAFGLRLPHRWPRVLEGDEQAAPVASASVASDRRREASWIRVLAAQNQMYDVFRATWPDFDLGVSDFGSDAWDEESGDEEQEDAISGEEDEEFLDPGYGVSKEMMDITSSERKILRSWNGKVRRGSGCPSCRSERQVLRSWNGRARRGSRCPTLTDGGSEAESDGELVDGPEDELIDEPDGAPGVAFKEESREKKKGRRGFLRKVRESGKKLFKK
jgi:hypothetical protein